MADNANNTAEGQDSGTQNATNNTEDKSGTQNASQTTEDTNTNDKTEKTFTQADVNRLIKRETDKLEKRLKLDEDGRRAAELDDLKTQLRERDARDSVRESAEKSGAKNASLIYKVVKDDLEFDKDGKVTNLKDVLEQAKKDFPDLFNASSDKANDKVVDKKALSSVDAGEGNGKPQTTLTKEQIDKMSPAEINKNWDAVQMFLTAQK